MPPSLAEVVAHPLFLSFLATAASWRERLQLQDVFYRVLRALNYTAWHCNRLIILDKMNVELDTKLDMD